MRRGTIGLAAGMGFSMAVAVSAGGADVPETPAGKTPTAAEAKAFVDDAQKRLLELRGHQSRADGVQSTSITEDTEIGGAQAADKTIEASVRYAKDAVRFDGLTLDPETARQLKLLKLSLTMAAPSDPAERAELTRIATAMEGAYG